ncbi:MAG TPA: hypothetical protein VNZ67_05070, partial [bacterium]|nr:hypothetical protein [bacterium]
MVLCLGAAKAGAYTSIPWVMQGFGYTPVNAPGLIELTNNGTSQDGVAWNPCPINMGGNWDLQFVFNFGAMQCGGDGMSFILQAASNNGNSPTTSAFPTNGGSNSGEKGYTGIPNSLAIAFNTYPQPYMPNQQDSINLLVNGHNEASYSDVVGCGTGAVITGPCFPSISSTLPNVKDGQDHPVDISWNNATDQLTVSVDGVARGTWTLPASYVSTIFNNDASVVYGVGASSGGATNYQQFAQTSAIINNCQATPTVVATATLIPLPTNNCGNTPLPTFT